MSTKGNQDGVGLDQGTNITNVGRNTAGFTLDGTSAANAINGAPAMAGLTGVQSGMTPDASGPGVAVGGGGNVSPVAAGWYQQIYGTQPYVSNTDSSNFSFTTPDSNTLKDIAAAMGKAGTQLKLPDDSTSQRQSGGGSGSIRLPAQQFSSGINGTPTVGGTQGGVSLLQLMQQLKG